MSRPLLCPDGLTAFDPGVLFTFRLFSLLPWLLLFAGLLPLFLVNAFNVRTLVRLFDAGAR